MAYLLDGVVILILIMTCIVGYCKGFLKYVVAMLCTIVTTFVAAGVADLAAEPVYNSFVKEKVCTELEKELSKIDVLSIIQNEINSELGTSLAVTTEDISEVISKGGDIAQNVGTMLEEKGAASEQANEIKKKFSSYLSDDVYQDMEKSLGEDSVGKVIVDNSKKIGDSINELLVKVTDTDKSVGAQYIEEKIVRPMTVVVIQLALFVVIQILLYLIISIILHVTGTYKKLKPESAANHFGGIVIGVLMGAVYISIIAFALSVYVNATDNSLSSFNTSVVDDTYLFRYFFSVFYE